MFKNTFVVLGLALSAVSGGAQAQKLFTFDPVPKPPVVAKSLAPKAASAKDAAGHAAARKAIAAQYMSVEKATVRNNLPGVMNVIAPDFQYFDTTGRVTDRVGYQGLQAETLRTSTKVRFTYTIKSITWRGADAVVMAQSRFQGVYNRRNFDLRTSSRDYWSATSRGWMIRQRVDTDIRGFLNGVKVDYNPLLYQAPQQSQVPLQPQTMPQPQAAPQAQATQQPQATTPPPTTPQYIPPPQTGPEGSIS